MMSLQSPGFDCQLSIGVFDILTFSFRFWLTFAGQAVMAMGHPFLITMSTKVVFVVHFLLIIPQVSHAKH